MLNPMWLNGLGIYKKLSSDAFYNFGDDLEFQLLPLYMFFHKIAHSISQYEEMRKFIYEGLV